MNIVHIQVFQELNSGNATIGKQTSATYFKRQNIMPAYLFI